MSDIGTAPGRFAYRCQHGDRVTVIVADDFVEALERSRVFVGAGSAETLELRLIGPVYDPAHVRYTDVRYTEVTP